MKEDVAGDSLVSASSVGDEKSNDFEKDKAVWKGTDDALSRSS